MTVALLFSAQQPASLNLLFGATGGGETQFAASVEAASAEAVAEVLAGAYLVQAAATGSATEVSACSTVLPAQSPQSAIASDTATHGSSLMAGVTESAVPSAVQAAVQTIVGALSEALSLTGAQAATGTYGATVTATTAASASHALDYAVQLTVVEVVVAADAASSLVARGAAGSASTSATGEQWVALVATATETELLAAMEMAAAFFTGQMILVMVDANGDTVVLNRMQSSVVSHHVEITRCFKVSHSTLT